MKLAWTSVAGALVMTGCTVQAPTGAETFTLYRNSYLDHSMRIHFATFDARESDRNYNRNNCEMAARLLNSNITAFAKTERKERDSGLGFWCEPGGYSEKGVVPSTFPEAFPTDA
jgi:hypothetical protein